MKTSAYLLQAILVVIWWLGLVASEPFFAVFQFPGISPIAFRSFLLPDLLLIAGLSVWRSIQDRKSLEWLVLGAFSYATFYCWNATWLTGGGWLSTITMTFGLGYNLFLCFAVYSFRESVSPSRWWNGSKTLLQLIGIWGLTLVIIPAGVQLSLGQELVPGQYAGLAVVLLGCFSALGVWSAAIMVWFGEGTPLPLDQPRQLVIRGPYRWVRNPMAIAGIGQGLSVALLLGSWPLVFYSLLGALVWQVAVRPMEEKNLSERFGDQYRVYREGVRCWWPRRPRGKLMS